MHKKNDSPNSLSQFLSLSLQENMFKQDTEKNHRYREECSLINRCIFQILLSVILVMECVMIFLYIVGPFFVENASFYPQYIYLYVSMVILCPVLLIMLHINKKNPAVLQWIELCSLLIMCVWSAIFSACDVINGYSSYLFIQFIVINSLAVRMPPFVHCSVNILSFLVYLVIILFSGLSTVTLFAETINPLFMAVVACILVLLNDRLKIKSFLNKELIEEQHKELEFYANNDYLTKIPNRKSIIEFLEDAIAAPKSSIACLMIDIDNFKLYNDTYGHVTGDTCLCRLASALEDTALSRGGHIGRYGGEEFLAVFVDKSRQSVMETASELIKTAINENIDFPNSGVYPMVTISIGVYYTHSENINQETLIRNSDMALYQAKSEGRNRISVYKET